MRTGASPRPIASRIAATRPRTWSGDWQLRWNRMKPSGSASRKNSRSSRVSDGPAQPKIAARGSRLGKDAPDAATPEFLAVARRDRLVCHRPCLDAVVDSVPAEIDPLGLEGQLAENV